jgi:hypothetical protein
MLRIAVFMSALTLVPSFAVAQAPCTTDARRVVEEIYRHVLERAPDNGSQGWVDRLSGGATVREVVRGIAKSPEHIQRFGTEERSSVVSTMYRHILNREPDAQARRDAVNVAARRGVPDVVDQLIDSPEYQQKFGDWQVPGSSGVTYCARNAQSRNEQSRNMRFRRFDANGDGRISRNEWRGNAQSFSNFDWNNDGVLSGDEVNSNRAWNDDNEGRNDNMAYDERFDYLDINGNGFVDRNEWDGGYNVFTRLDANNDRRLSRDEWESTNRPTNNFASVDLNRDGRIALSEWPWSHSSFDRQDTNGDGVVSRTEYRGAPQTFRR